MCLLFFALIVFCFQKHNISNYLFSFLDCFNAYNNRSFISLLNVPTRSTSRPLFNNWITSFHRFYSIHLRERFHILVWLRYHHNNSIRWEYYICWFSNCPSRRLRFHSFDSIWVILYYFISPKTLILCFTSIDLSHFLCPLISIRIYDFYLLHQTILKASCKYSKALL